MCVCDKRKREGKEREICIESTYSKVHSGLMPERSTKAKKDSQSRRGYTPIRERERILTRLPIIYHATLTNYMDIGYSREMGRDACVREQGGKAERQRDKRQDTREKQYRGSYQI